MTELGDAAAVAAAAPRVLAPPSTCGDEMEQIDWASSFSVSVGEFVIGIRTTSAILTELLTDALASHVRAELTAPAYYSIKVGTPSRRRATPMHYLYVGGHAVFGSRDLKRVVEALLGRLSMHAIAGGAGSLCVRGVPVAANDRVVLAPPELLAYPIQIERLLLARDVAVGTHEFVTIVADGRLQLPANPLVIRDEAIAAARLEQVAPVDIEPSLPAAPWQPDHWLVETGDDAPGALDAARAVLHGARQIRLPLPTDAQQALEEICAVLDTTTMFGVSWQTPEELCDLVAAMVAQ